MSTTAIVLIIVGAIVLVALIALASQRSRERRLQARREHAAGLRETAEAHSLRAERASGPSRPSDSTSPSVRLIWPGSITIALMSSTPTSRSSSATTTTRSSATTGAPRRPRPVAPPPSTPARRSRPVEAGSVAALSSGRNRGRLVLVATRRLLHACCMSGLLGEIGTIEWSRRTNGILSRGERARFVAVLMTTARILPRLLGARAGLRGSTRLSSRSRHAVRPRRPRRVRRGDGDLDPMIVQHGLRSYLFARALGVAEAPSSRPTTRRCSPPRSCTTTRSATSTSSPTVASPWPGRRSRPTCSPRRRCRMTCATAPRRPRCDHAAPQPACGPGPRRGPAPRPRRDPARRAGRARLAPGPGRRAARAADPPTPPRLPIPASRCCAPTASGCTAAAPVRCSRRGSGPRCGRARGVAPIAPDRRRRR